jgi:LCP family protein required for cell wall assembly
MAIRKKSEKNGKYKKTKIIFGILILFILALAWVAGSTLANLNKAKKTEISISNEDLGISEEALEKALKYDVLNFALFGIDSRDEEEPGRSDSIIIATIDKTNKKIKLSSIMRDTYVEISDHGSTKINHAYAYGGPQLALETINSNFNLDIKYFATVDFFDMEKIIDALGGVEIDVTNEEVEYINGYSNETATISKEERILVTKPGIQVLNGMQAVAYTRIRYTAGGDYMRTERQRTVLTALLKKLASMDKAKFIATVPTLAQYVETNMSATDMISIGVDALKSGISNIEQERFPIDGNASDEKINGIYYLKTDIDLTTEQIHEFIYDDIKPVMKTK